MSFRSDERTANAFVELGVALQRATHLLDAVRQAHLDEVGGHKAEVWLLRQQLEKAEQTRIAMEREIALLNQPKGEPSE